MNHQSRIQKLILILGTVFGIGCSSTPVKTVEKVDLPRFMGSWYVLAGRFTSFEQDAYNGVESYKLNPDEDHIQISFDYNKGSVSGEKKSIPQKGWIHNKESKAHWKVSPMWPLRFNYLIVALADDYSWVAVGVPDQKYLWIMSRDWKNPEPTIQFAVKALEKMGYDATLETHVTHSH